METKNIIPNFYNRGFPLFWMNEQSGKMAEAVKTYYDMENRERYPERLQLLKAYLLHNIKAPVWLHGPAGPGWVYTMIDLAEKIQSWEDIDQYLKECDRHLYDPL